MATKAEIAKTATDTVLEAKQRQSDFTPTTDNIIGLIDRIGKTVRLDGDQNIDLLPEISGEKMSFGRTIQEYNLDFLVRTARDKNANSGSVPAYPTKRNVYYNYALAEGKWKVTIPLEDIEKACTSAEEAGNIAARVLGRQADSKERYVYDAKKQLIGNAIKKATATANAARMVTEIAQPTDTSTGEAFLRKVKDLVRAAKYPNTDNLANALAKGTGSLVLYVKPGILSSIEIDTQAGAFHMDKLAPGCEIKEVEDFGDADASVYAILVDTRGLRLHDNYQFSMIVPNGDAGAYTHFLHYACTGFISGYTYLHVFKQPA